MILARTIKGYGLGEGGEGRNITHQQKKLNVDEVREFRTRFGIPISDDQVAAAPFYRPPGDSPEMIYLHDRRNALGGPVPSRGVRCEPLGAPSDRLFEELLAGSDGREISTTMAFVKLLTNMLKDKQIGRLIVPIIPDEARTFGMESLFRQVGIYSHAGQLYEPVDADTLLYYREATDGQILEEGITEAGSMASFIAAGTAHASHGINTIPFFIFYSMFGLQRIGDLIWAAGDVRARGFLMGGTSGRTTLNGEGLQHQDGNSHLLAYPVPNLRAYDPAFAYELAVIIRDGVRRMFVNQEDCFYYITVMNEPYVMPPAPEGVEEGILRGLYRVRTCRWPDRRERAHLFGSGAILNEVMRAQQMLEERFDVAADVWSITSFKELHSDGVDADRWNRLHPAEPRRQSWIETCLADTDGVYVIASDYVKALPNSISRWFPKRPVNLGTDGFGRSETRAALRRFFEIDAEHVAAAALSALAREGRIETDFARSAISDLGIDPDVETRSGAEIRKGAGNVDHDVPPRARRERRVRPGREGPRRGRRSHRARPVRDRGRNREGLGRGPVDGVRDRVRAPHRRGRSRSDRAKQSSPWRRTTPRPTPKARLRPSLTGRRQAPIQTTNRGRKRRRRMPRGSRRPPSRRRPPAARPRTRSRRRRNSPRTRRSPSVRR